MEIMWKWTLVVLVSVLSLQAEDYCFGFLNAVPDRKKIADTEAEEIQKGHMEHMGRMNAAGHLLTAGPIATPGNIRGILVYRCKSLEEARQWTAQDPAVINGRLTLDTVLWRGTKGFGEPLMELMKADPNTKINMTQLPLILLKKTSSWTAEPVETIADHNREVAALRKAGKLRAVGPVLESATLAGLMVFAGMPLEEAEKAAKDLALVRSGYATVQALTWFVANEAVPIAGQ